MNNLALKMQDVEQKCFESKRLRYRPLVFDDYEDIYECGKDAENCRFLSWEPYSSVEKAKEFVDSRIADGDLLWGIVEKREDKLIGTIRFYDYQNEDCSISISYILNRSYSGRGYMTESLKTMIEISNLILPIKVIYTYYSVENVKSKNVMLRAGMVFDENYTEQRLVKNQMFTYKRCFYEKNFI